MAELLHPYDLLFALPLLFGVLMSVAQATGLTDLDLDVDADFEPDADMDADADGDGDGSGERLSLGHDALSLLGVGRVPLTLILIALSMVFGVTGLLLNHAAASVLGDSAWLLALPLATVLSVVTTGRIARGLARLAPSIETYAERPEALVGLAGVAAVDIDADFGRAVVSGNDGTRHEVPCKSRGERLARGSEVLLVEHDAEAACFVVEAFSLVRELN